MYALEGSRPANIFKIPASEMLIWGISGTLGLNVPEIFFLLSIYQFIYTALRPQGHSKQVCAIS